MSSSSTSWRWFVCPSHLIDINSLEVSAQKPTGPMCSGKRWVESAIGRRRPRPACVCGMRFLHKHKDKGDASRVASRCPGSCCRAEMQFLSHQFRELSRSCQRRVPTLQGEPFSRSNLQTKLGFSFSGVFRIHTYVYIYISSSYIRYRICSSTACSFSLGIAKVGHSRRAASLDNSLLCLRIPMNQ